jgi:hypothetical protein
VREQDGTRQTKLRGASQRGVEPFRTAAMT